MTPRERVQAALRHSVPDRVPLDLGATESSGLTAIAYNRLKARLGMQSPTRVIEPYQQVVLVDPPLLDALEIDAVALHYEPRQWQPTTFADGSTGEIPAQWQEIILADGSREVRTPDGRLAARMPSGGFYYEPGDPPLAGITRAAEVDPDAECIRSFDLPSFSDETWTERGERAQRLHATGRAVVGNLCCHFLAAGQLLRGYENFMCDLVAEKSLAHALLEALCDAYLERLETYLRYLGDYLDVILVNDDLGTQNGPMLSPRVYRETIKPYQKRFFGAIRSKFSGGLLMHSCGAISDFIPDLIECGVQAINPVQVSAQGMAPERLKREFGKDMVFWGGGCDTQHVLNKGSVEDVQREVRRNVAALSPGGGFVFTQVHNIQPDVPAENVLAMVRALRAG